MLESLRSAIALDEAAAGFDRFHDSLVRRRREATPCPAPIGKKVSRRQISLHSVVVSFIIFDIAALGFSAIGVAELLYSFGATGLAVSEAQIAVVIFAIALHPFIATAFRLYRVERTLDWAWQRNQLMLSLFVTFSFMVMLAVAAKSAENYSRLWFFGWFVCGTSAMLSSRKLVIRRARVALRDRAYVFKAISVGVGCLPFSAREIARKSKHEVFVVSEQRIEQLSDLASLSDLIAEEAVDQVYIATFWDTIPAVLRKVDLLAHLSTEVLVLPSDRAMRDNVSQLAFFGDRLSFKALEQPIYGWSLWFKRAEDIAISVLGLALASPLLLLVALAIKLESPGPVLFYQKRAGFNGRVFELRKFRSMYVEQTDHHAAQQTVRNDPRVTRVGRLIRRFSIDELPQLINVLDSTMSVVGPRPHALETRTEGRNLEELVDYYAVRHRVKPGLTGWAQVHGFRGELNSIEKLQCRVDYDIDYINKWTLWLDAKIVARTLLILLRDKSAY